MSRLWYQNPAEEWEEALPIGNGRLGAMIYGKVNDEIIQVNEESMWYGAPQNRNNPDALKALPQIREYIFKGDIKNAEKLMKYAFSGTPESMRPYQTLGNIHLHFDFPGEYSDYYRELDLESAVCKQSFKVEDTVISRQIFASKPADAIIMYFKSDSVVKISFDAVLRRERYFDGVKKSSDHAIYLYGNLGKGGIDFGMTLSAQVKDGKVHVIGEHLVVEDASEVLLYFTANTSYRLGEGIDIEKANLERISELEKIKYSMLVKEHMDDYRNLYGRVEFGLGDLSEYDIIPTDERIKKASKKKHPDIGLSKLYFDYGRYLLISCSRRGTLPATLQGIWNKDMLPPWDSKYTVNINTQMNYWPAEICGLGECHEPLFELIKKMVPNGERTAREMYGCNGFVCHHNTDIYGDTAPQDMWIPGTYWVMGGAWLCTHLWSHYLYTQDEEFLKEYFPIIRKAAEFFLDFCVEHKGHMVTCPSVSPENTFILPNGQKGSNIFGVTMDNQILRDLFTACIEGAEVLGISDEMNEKIIRYRDMLIPTQIGINGNILEWPADYEEVEPGHRHISHLYGLCPSDQISVDKTPELAKAARVTLEKRLSAGGGHTGWSRAWIINDYAKLWDGEEAYKNLSLLFENSTYLNLFDKHPPFQIDGNFGATAAIASMIVQSDKDRIVIIPAIPKAWKTGYMNGIRVKGCGCVNVSWKNGKLLECSVTFEKKADMKIKIGDFLQEVHFEEGQTRVFKGNLLGKIKEVTNK